MNHAYAILNGTTTHSSIRRALPSFANKTRDELWKSDQCPTKIILHLSNLTTSLPTGPVVLSSTDCQNFDAIVRFFVAQPLLMQWRERGCRGSSRSNYQKPWDENLAVVFQTKKCNEHVVKTNDLPGKNAKVTTKEQMPERGLHQHTLWRIFIWWHSG